MPYITDQQINTGQFIETTAVWDTAQLYETDVKSPEFKELLVRLYQRVNNIALALNNKDTGFYVQTEFNTGQNLFPNPTPPAGNYVGNQDINQRGIYRLVVNIGAVGAGVTTVAHGLTFPVPNIWSFVQIFGAATDTVGGNYYPLPWASAAGATNIELKVNNTNVVITNNSGINFTVCYVVLEYVKS
jgi:hypothetical protein